MNAYLSISDPRFPLLLFPVPRLFKNRYHFLIKTNPEPLHFKKSPLATANNFPVLMSTQLPQRQFTTFGFISSIVIYIRVDGNAVTFLIDDQYWQLSVDGEDQSRPQPPNEKIWRRSLSEQFQKLRFDIIKQVLNLIAIIINNKTNKPAWSCRGHRRLRAVCNLDKRTSRWMPGSY